MELKFKPTLHTLLLDNISIFGEDNSWELLEIGARGFEGTEKPFLQTKNIIKEKLLKPDNVWVSDIQSREEVNKELQICNCGNEKCIPPDVLLNYVQLDLLESDMVKRLDDKKFDLIYIANVIHISVTKKNDHGRNSKDMIYNSKVCRDNVQALKNHLKKGGYLFIRGFHPKTKIESESIRGFLDNWEIESYIHNLDNESYCYLCRP